MSFELPKLPYEMNALEPYISQETLEYHYGKHHQAYVNNLNNLIHNTEFEKCSLEDIILRSSGPLFNNAAQVWNHTFYWHCLTPHSQAPNAQLNSAIEQAFGSFERFKELFTQSAVTLFGSGWTWLVKNAQGQLEIVNTGNASLPLKDGKIALLTCDVWEHAYYIDVRNARPKYLENYWQLVNWDFVANNFTGSTSHG